MSFDTTFDYTDIIADINTHIGKLDDKVDAIDAELQIYGNADPDLMYLTEGKVSGLNSHKTFHNNEITVATTALSDINEVETLESNSKTIVYSFFDSYVNEPANDFMARLAVYHAEIIVDATNVMNGNIETNEEGNMYAELICEKYPKRTATGRFITNSIIYTV